VHPSREGRGGGRLGNETGKLKVGRAYKVVGWMEGKEGGGR